MVDSCSRSTYCVFLDRILLLVRDKEVFDITQISVAYLTYLYSFRCAMRVHFAYAEFEWQQAHNKLDELYNMSHRERVSI